MISGAHFLCYGNYQEYQIHQKLHGLAGCAKARIAGSRVCRALQRWEIFINQHID